MALRLSGSGYEARLTSSQWPSNRSAPAFSSLMIDSNVNSDDFNLLYNTHF